MSRARTLALVVRFGAVIGAAACSNSNPESNGSPRACQLDAECGDHAYCTQAHVCRTDCYTDVECIGPGTAVQCTSHGQCIDTTGDTGVVDAPIDDAKDETIDDAKSSDTKDDAKDTGAGEGGP
jgi:hypothetical protein